MQTLKPIYDYDKYSKPIAKVISQTFYETIFAPLFAILDIPDSRSNASTTALKDALVTGKIRYDNGFFYGDWTATLSKQLRGIGAVYNKTRKAYALGQSSLPQDIKMAIREGNELARNQVAKVETFLKAVEGRKINLPDLEPLFSEVISGLDKQFNTTTKEIRATDVEIPIEPRLGIALKESYTDNLDMYIQEWHDHEILRLRQKVAKNVAQGFRAETLVETIKAERGVSHRKAQFLARQETSLMVSKYRQVRYEDVGINKYIWSTSHDSRVRHDHRILDKKVFDFSNPPVTDLTTGARNNPGEDFNCRCVAIPVMSNREVLERQYVGA